MRFVVLLALYVLVSLLLHKVFSNNDWYTPWLWLPTVPAILGISFTHYLWAHFSDDDNVYGAPSGTVIKETDEYIVISADPAVGSVIRVEKSVWNDPDQTKKVCDGIKVYWKELGYSER